MPKKIEWTEEDDLRLERDRRNEQLKMILSYREQFEKRMNESEEAYQSAGDGRSRKAYERNRDIVDICDLAIQRISDGCADCARRERNAAAIRQRFRKMQEAGEPLKYEFVIDQLYGV